MPPARPKPPARPAASAAATNPCLAAALDYRRLGWAALALCPPDHAGMHEYHLAECASPGKCPIGRWKEYATRLPTEAELKAAFGRFPGANVGVAFGPASGLCGIDVDGEPGEDLLRELSGGDLPDTLTFVTGRAKAGLRLLYALPDPKADPRRFSTVPVRNADGAEPLKLMAAGSQTVMPPSRHETGSVYRWAKGKAPGDIPLAPAPKWLLDRLAKTIEAVARPGSLPTAAGTTAPSRGRELALKAADGAPIPEGGRETALIAIAGAVRRFGATEAEIATLLEKVNERCSPPLDPASLARLARSAARYAPAEVPSTPALKAEVTAPAPAVAAAAMVSPTAAEFEPELPHWLWPGWLPHGSLVCVDGYGGVGKSQVLIDLAARLTTGRAMPDGTRPTAFEGPQNALIVCCEDSYSATVLPRVLAAGGDPGRISLAEEVVEAGKGLPRDRLTGFTLPEHLDALERLVADRGVRLVVIDPITAFMSSANDYAKDQDVRRVVGPLKHIAQRYGCTVLYVRHWNKGGEGQKAAHRGGGSLGFLNVARAAVMMGVSPDATDEKRVFEFAWLKGNLAEPQPGLQYRIVKTEVPGPAGPVPATRVEWLGRSPYKPDEIAGDHEALADKRAAADEAEAWLRSHLARGPARPAEVDKAARKEKVKPEAVRRAATRMGLVPSAEVWSLPTATPKPPTPTPAPTTAPSGPHPGGGSRGEVPAESESQEVG